MTIERIDLTLAVEQGIVSEHQAERLRELASARSGDSDSTVDYSQDPRDEPFRFMKGFGDLFIALATIILSVGLWTLSPESYFSLGDIGLSTKMNPPVRLAIVLILLVGHFVIGETLIRRRRLPLAGMALCLGTAFWGAKLFYGLVDEIVAWDSSSTFYLSDEYFSLMWFLKACGAAIASAVFYLRYRLPSGLFILALFLVAAGAAYLNTKGVDWSSLTSRIFIGGSGLLAFLIATGFDVSDRQRRFRRSECAFWLHLVAAPLMSHAILSYGFLDSPSLILLIAVFVGLSSVSLLIDRRSFLVSGMIYMGIALGTLLTRSEIVVDQKAALTVCIVGAIALALGLGWELVRRRLVALIPDGRFKRLLPDPA
ncbi:MAG: hypothetical protein RIC16_05300 [Rhodospirillales bacterium]